MVQIDLPKFVKPLPVLPTLSLVPSPLSLVTIVRIQDDVIARYKGQKTRDNGQGCNPWAFFISPRYGQRRPSAESARLRHRRRDSFPRQRPPGGNRQGPRRRR